MYSLLSWLGVLVIFGGLVGTFLPRWVDFGWRDSVFGLVVSLLTVVQFAYLHRLHCPDQSLPDGGIAIAVAFEPEDPDAEKAGLANLKLADWLNNNASKFSRIMTQEAIIWALVELKHLPKAQADVPLAGYLHDVKVERIHRHIPGANVRTLETFCCAKEQFGDTEPGIIVLVAHDKHYERAYRDLRSQFKTSRIVNSCIFNVPYSTDFFLNRIGWAARELFIARPIECLLRKGRPACRPDVTW